MTLPSRPVLARYFAHAWERCTRAMEMHRKEAALVGLCTLAVCGGGAWLYVRWARTPLPPVSVPPPVAVEQVTKRRWLDGLPMPVSAPQPHAIGIMVDNAPEARPQTGIADAPLVLTVPVEGQRTRFLAVAEATAEDAFGPVRSARPYFVGLVDMLETPYAHVGGSPAAFALLKTRSHVDEWYRAPYYRSTTRSAPFNAYAEMEDLVTFFVERDAFGDARPDDWHLWEYADAEAAADGSPATFSIRLGAERAFDVSWTYDAAQRAYVRSQGGRVHRDVNGIPVTAQNVVVLRVDSVVLDRIGRLAIPQLDPPVVTPLASRKYATLLTGGTRTDGTWGWSDPQADTGGLFGLRRASGDGAGASMVLAPGTTWVEFVNGDWEAAYVQHTAARP
ncbi:MAG: DUF3048 domain-containing protein [bacterium]|nr:DUF3048 domain-containing protein [bacterium]